MGTALTGIEASGISYDSPEKVRAAAAPIVSKLKREGPEPTFSPLRDRQGNHIFGCKHYERSCKIEARCCDGAFVTCRRCHDELFAGGAAEHVLDRKSVRKLLCMRCGKESPVAANCSNAECGQPFGEYVCEICPLFDSRRKDIYHCHKCGICRQGKAEDNEHCDSCGICVNKRQPGGHPCIEASSGADCPVCRENLFDSVKPFGYLLCGHAIHKECLESATQFDYRCSLCFKSVCDMGPVWKRLDDRIASEPVPSAYANRMVSIYCNDCNTHSTVPFHFRFHKCPGPDHGQPCGSYNTRRT